MTTVRNTIMSTANTQRVADSSEKRIPTAQKWALEANRIDFLINDLFAAATNSKPCANVTCQIKGLQHRVTRESQKSSASPEIHQSLHYLAFEQRHPQASSCITPPTARRSWTLQPQVSAPATSISPSSRTKTSRSCSNSSSTRAKRHRFNNVRNTPPFLILAYLDRWFQVASVTPSLRLHEKRLDEKHGAWRISLQIADFCHL